MEKLRSCSTTMADVVMGYQSVAQASRPYGKHSLLSAHQRRSSPLTQSMMGFRNSHFPHTGKPHASSRQTVGVMNAIFLRFYTMANQACVFIYFFPYWILHASYQVCFQVAKQLLTFVLALLKCRKDRVCHTGLREPHKQYIFETFSCIIVLFVNLLMHNMGRNRPGRFLFSVSLQ